MPSPLLPTFEKRISDATDQILHQQVNPWLFISNGLSVKRADGRSISLGPGIMFEGSPRQVFWSRYIEPFLENMAIAEMSAASAAAKERDVDASVLIPEVQGLLLSATSKVLSRMADVDRRLRGNGFPDRINLRNTQSEYALIAEFIDRHAQAELNMWRPKSIYQQWYEENKFWVWALPIIAGAIYALIGFL